MYDDFWFHKRSSDNLGCIRAKKTYESEGEGVKEKEKVDMNQNGLNPNQMPSPGQRSKCEDER